MNYRLYISFKDKQRNEKIVIEGTDIQHLYDEMKYSEAYGIPRELLKFPSFEEFQNKLSILNTGQTKYLIKSYINSVSYVVSIKRIF